MRRGDAQLDAPHPGRQAVFLRQIAVLHAQACVLSCLARRALVQARLIGHGHPTRWRIPLVA